MATANVTESLCDPLGVVKRVTKLYFAMSVLFILLGLFGIFEPMAAGLGVGILVGWLLVVGGVVHTVAAFRAGDAKHVMFELLIAIVDLGGGSYFLLHPFMAVEMLTLLLTLLIVTVGLLRVIWYVRLKSVKGSEWLLLDGIVAIVVGGMIGMHLPSSAVWAIGALMGVKLLVTGITRLLFGLAVRKMVAQAAAS